MPTRQPNPGLFKRWLLLVYLPLGTFVLCLALAVGKILHGFILWLVALLGIYCVIPARLILETQRKGLELPKPPGAKSGPAANRLEKVAPRSRDRAARPALRQPRPREGVAADVRAEPDESPVRRSREEPDESPVRRSREEPDESPVRRSREEPAGDAPDDFAIWRSREEASHEDPDELSARRPVAATEGRSAKRVTERLPRPRRETPKKSPQVVRRRALASIIGIGALLGLGGILVIIGIGKVTSSFGLVMVGVGGFLMILSVTLPTFRLVDAALRGIGRLLSRRPQPRRD